MSYLLLASSWPRARKAYRCIWCGESIALGEVHRHESSKYDGQFQEHRWHRECDEAAGEVFRGSEDEFQPYENERPERNND